MRAAHERELRDRYERQLQDERRIHGTSIASHFFFSGV